MLLPSLLPAGPSTGSSFRLDPRHGSTPAPSVSRAGGGAAFRGVAFALGTLIAFLALSVLATPPAWSAEEGDRALLLVPAPPPSLAGALLADDVLVVQSEASHLLVVGGTRERAVLEALGAPSVTLADDADGATFYNVIPRSAASWDALRGLSVVSAPDRGAALPIIVAATPEEAAVLSGTGAEIARIFLRPVRLPEDPSQPAPSQLPRRATGTPGSSDASSTGRSEAMSPGPAGDLDVSVARRAVDPWIVAQVALVEGPRIDADVLRLQNFVTRYAGHDSCDAAAAWIAERFHDLGIDDVSFQYFGGSWGPNVIAVIPGQGHPEEQIVIGGHYDSITSNYNNCPGADDNASGTAGVLECARVLSQGIYDRTIVVVAYGGEELGLLGSEAYAQAAAARGDDIVASIAVDMIGYVANGDTRDLDIIANGSSEWLRSLVIATAAEYVPTTPSVNGTIPSGASSDHYSFWQAGYDAVLFFEDSGSYSPYIHTTSDVVGTSYRTPQLALDSTRILTAVVATLAGPFELAIDHDPLTDTEDSAHGYEVRASIRAAGTIDPSGLLVHVSAGTNSFSLPLLATADPEIFTATIPAQVPGTFVEYWIEANDLDGHHATDPVDAPTSTHRFFVGAKDVVYADDLEGESGWTVGTAGDDATTGVWVRVDPNGTWSGDVPVQPEDDHTSAPGTRCFVTGNTAAGGGQGDNDVDGGRTTLLSPTIDLSAATVAWVRYARWYSNDTGSEPGTDLWQVDVSNDGGTTWHPIEATYASNHSWAVIERELSAILPLTGTMRFRFVAADEDPGSVVEAAVDDLEILAFVLDPVDAGDGVGTDALAQKLGITSCAPNPFHDGLEVRFSVPAGSESIELGLYDAAGRRVALLAAGPALGGSQVVRWDGRDASGRSVPSGVYFLRLSDGRTMEEGRVLRVR